MYATINGDARKAKSITHELDSIICFLTGTGCGRGLVMTSHAWEGLVTDVSVYCRLLRDGFTCVRTGGVSAASDVIYDPAGCFPIQRI